MAPKRRFPFGRVDGRPKSTILAIRTQLGTKPGRTGVVRLHFTPAFWHAMYLGPCGLCAAFDAPDGSGPGDEGGGGVPPASALRVDVVGIMPGRPSMDAPGWFGGGNTMFWRLNKCQWRPQGLTSFYSVAARGGSAAAARVGLLRRAGACCREAVVVAGRGSSGPVFIRPGRAELAFVDGSGGSTASAHGQQGPKFMNSSQ